ncbi:MAG TPA: tRNA (guanosine(37)-N1)-methyltransferase TrmD [Casimicrobiaceae bacterium]|nr:tRNA (guanosine(37)-N1)-methyltransferase TrmD [Casimicrobiaceae bacterium]
MRIDVVTLFPEMVAQAAAFGVTGRALARGLWQLGLWNPREFTTDNHKTVDDRPYGGGPGMVMLAEPLAEAIAAARSAQAAAGVAATRVIYMSPAGVPLTHERVLALALQKDAGYILLAGRYEGIDERLLAREADEELAIGDFVVSGGELPALMLIDAVARQLPGALNDELSAQQDSFADGLLDCPHYTRPEVLDGIAVPEVLMSGHHEQIRRWRLQQALGRTWERRPELLRRRQLTSEEAALLAAYQQQSAQAKK